MVGLSTCVAADSDTGDSRYAPGSTGKYQCDGRTYCTQMKSCDEARWFLANCPGTKMDGDRDGVPCEKQWCGDGVGR
ncbi:excalibur calcium-binding domain-containing protein [uncultured Thiodictyon sp.]|nr:excalibur calcium-binding domain-containing protein [uncultured Thiodictyon sp.]